MSDELLLPHLRLLNPSLPVASFSTMNLNSSFSTLSSEISACIDDEAELSDWVSGLRLNSSRTRLSSGGGRGGGGRERERVSPAERGSVSDLDDCGISNRGMGRDCSVGSFSSGKAGFGAQLEGENEGFVYGGDEVDGCGGHGGSRGGRGGGRSGGFDNGGGLKKGGFESSDEETDDDDDDDNDDDNEDDDDDEDEGKERLMKNFRDLISEEEDSEEDDDMLETRFDQCSVSSLSLKGIKDAGYEKMIVVQEATLAVILKGKDVLAKAKIGTGKTVSFLVGLPADREQYIHQLGRTGHEGKEGQGILLLAPWEEFLLSAIKDSPITKATLPLVDPEMRKKVERSLVHVEMKNKEAAYQVWLGYYNSNKNAGWDKCILVELANEFRRSMGLNNPPGIPKHGLGKMGLKTFLLEVNFAHDHLVMGLPQLSASENGNPVTDSYDSWLLKHPSALDTFQQMMSIAKGRKIVVFLDYDGTLSNIVDNPEKAFMTNKMQMTLREVAHYFPTAIISGRSRDKVYDFVKLDNVYYAGSHGLDIAAPLQSPNYGDPRHQTRVVDRMGNEVVLFQPAKKFLPAIQKIFSTLIEKTRSIRGVMIENNKFCISVHFRHVHNEDFCTLEKLVNSVMGEYKEFRMSEGKKVLEIRPDMEWDKGHALNYLLDTLGLGNSSDVLPLYIGDDRTDEDAFKAIRNRGEGYPIVVHSIPKDTMALYTLRNPLEVQKFLLRLVRWRKYSSSGKFVF